MTVYNWLKSHRKMVITHSLILSGFLLYTFFLASPLFERFEAIEGEAKLQDFSLPVETSNISYSLSKLNATNQATEIEGWAFIDGQSTNGSEIYVVLKSDDKCYIFNTWPKQRFDVTIAFATLNLDLNWSGLMCIIPMRKVANGEYVLGIYIRNGDIEALHFIDKVLVKSKGTTHVTSRTPGNTSELQGISLPEESENIHYYVDFFMEVKEEGTEFIEIGGWTFIQEHSSENSQIYMVLESDTNTYVFDTILRQRSDVTAHFADTLNLNLDDSGFIARIPKEEIKSGTYRVGIYIKKDNVEGLRFTNKIITK